MPPCQLTLVIPCYNEEAILPLTLRTLLAKLDALHAEGKITATSQLYCIDDGSRDKSWSLVQQHALQEPRIRGLKLSRNFGHQAALLAGLLHAEGDALISLDADLQDDTTAIDTMVDAYHAGYEVVYGVREDRSNDSFWKRFAAEAYYRLLRRIGVNTVFNHADYRLLSRRAVEHLRDFREVNLFLRGLIPMLGFAATEVRYKRQARIAGESKYPIHRMLNLALDGITSLSSWPLRMITLLGLLVFTISTGLGLWALWRAFFGNGVVPGWASTVVPMYFLGGIQLLCIGIIGEYLRKLYLEVKARPRFIIEEKL